LHGLKEETFQVSEIAGDFDNSLLINRFCAITFIWKPIKLDINAWIIYSYCYYDSIYPRFINFTRFKKSIGYHPSWA
jgi:hypothetical protein